MDYPNVYYTTPYFDIARRGGSTLAIRCRRGSTEEIGGDMQEIGGDMSLETRPHINFDTYHDISLSTRASMSLEGTSLVCRHCKSGWLCKGVAYNRWRRA